MYHTSTAAIVRAKYMWFSFMVVIITLLLPRAAQRARPGLPRLGTCQQRAVPGSAVPARSTHRSCAARLPPPPPPPPLTLLLEREDLLQRALLELVEVQRHRHCEIVCMLGCLLSVGVHSMRADATYRRFGHTGGVRRLSMTTRITYASSTILTLRFAFPAAL